MSLFEITSVREGAGNGSVFDKRLIYVSILWFDLIWCWFMFPFCASPMSSFEITSVRAGDGSRSSAWLPRSWHRWSRTPEWINYYLVKGLTTWEAACQFGKVTKGELRNWGNWALHLCHTRLVLSIDTLGNGNHLVRLEMEMGWTFFSGAWNSLILS